jgi:hypothetical protein
VHYLVAGDWNAKNTIWGSRLMTTKGKNLLQVIQNNLNILSTGDPTYWPTDVNKIPDLLDFAIAKGISDIYTNLDLESDHTVVTITISATIIWKEMPLRLCNRHTSWDQFQTYINKKICLNIRLKQRFSNYGLQTTSGPQGLPLWFFKKDRRKNNIQMNCVSHYS